MTRLYRTQGEARLRLWVGGCGALLVAGSLVGLSSGNADARVSAEARAVAAQASAAGIRATVSAPGYLLVDTPVDAGGPLTQSVFESGGERTGFASSPYPGDLVLSLPGLLQGFGLPAVPFGYPLIASASDPSSPESVVQDPTDSYLLKALASPSASSASAEVTPGALPGGPGVRTSASTSVDEAGTVTATASTSIDGLVIGGVIDLGVVRSRTLAILAPGAAEPSISRSLEVVGASVAGVAVTIGEDGVKVADSTLPAPVLEPIEDLVNNAVRALEIDVRIVKGGDLEGGAFGNTLEIRSERTLPLPGDPRGTISVVFGSTTASILSGAESDPVAEQGPTSLDGTSPTADPSPPPVWTSTDLPPSVAPPVPGAPTDSATSVVSSLRPFDLNDGFRLFYLALALAGLVMVIGSGSTRGRSVRSGTWTS